MMIYKQLYIVIIFCILLINGCSSFNNTSDLIIADVIENVIENPEILLKIYEKYPYLKYQDIKYNLENDTIRLNELINKINKIKQFKGKFIIGTSPDKYIDHISLKNKYFNETDSIYKHELIVLGCGKLDIKILINFVFIYKNKKYFLVDVYY